MMKKILVALPLAAVVALGVTACEDGPTAAGPESGTVTNVVLVNGVLMPVAAPPPPSRGDLSAPVPDPEADVIGSEGNPVQLTPAGCSMGSLAEVEVAFTINGRTADGNSFNVLNAWETTGLTWTSVGLGRTEVVTGLDEQGPGAKRTETYWFPVSIENKNTENADSSATLSITPTIVVQTQNQPLNIPDGLAALVHVEFVACEDADPTPAPRLVVPRRWVVEATSSTGAVADFSRAVRAWDHEGNRLRGDNLVCTPSSGSHFDFEDTEVSCTATDSDGRQTTKTFNVYVHDTTAPIFTAYPSEPLTFTVNPDGLLLLDDLGDLVEVFGLVAKDYGPLGPGAGEISGPADIECMINGDPAEDYTLGLGEKVEVTCRATDQADFVAPGRRWKGHVPPNSSTVSFDIVGGLDLACGFGPPLRMGTPFSAHKRNSTVPHKVCAPTYADGTEATNIALLLGLRLEWQGSNSGTGDVDLIEDLSEGSKGWRWDSGDRHYIFNAKTANNWAPGMWTTTVTIGAFDLLSTQFELRR